MGTTTEVKDLILQAIVAYNNISSMPAGHGSMAKRIKGSIGAELNWTRGASPNQLKGPLISRRKNEGLPLTGDELCWHEEDSNKMEKSCSSIIPDKTFWVGVGEDRTEITEMALGSETWELNATKDGYSQH